MNRFYKIACVLLALTILVSYHSADVPENDGALLEGQGVTYAATATDLDVESEINLLDTESDESAVSENPKPYWENIPSDFNSSKEQQSEEKEENEPVIKEPETEKTEPEKEEIKEENVSSESTKKEPDSRLPVTPDYVPYMSEEEIILLEEGYPVRLQYTDPATLKFAMQENNPEPVSVNALKRKPQTVSFAYELLEGEEMEFEASYHYVGRGGGESDRCLIIYDNYEFYKQYGWSKLEGLYDEEFFEDNAIIGIHYIDGYDNAERNIESLTIKDGRLCIYVKNIFAGDAVDMTTSETHIKISKEDLSKIRSVVVYEEKIPIEKDGKTYYKTECIDSSITFPV